MPVARRTIVRRRRVAIAAAVLAVVAIAAVVVVKTGPPGLRNALGIPDEHGASVHRVQIASRAVGRTMPVSVIAPAPDGRRRPLLVLLHGRGADETSMLDEELFAALGDQGARAPVVALPAGRNAYWHDRSGAAWGRYVMDEVIPVVARRFHTLPGRVAIGGISMGGFGALDLARLHPGHFCAAGAHSPALWETGAETAPGAFDDAADFTRHDVIGAARTNAGAFAGMPLWLDAGDRDPFLGGDRTFVAALRTAGLKVHEHIWPGAHEHDYWAGHWSDYLRFYARALAACRR